MAKIDKQNDNFMKALINNIEGIFYHDERIPSENHPQDHPYMYHIRHDEDDWSLPITIEKVVYVNFFGTIFFRKPLELNEGEYINIESFFTDGNVQKLYVSDSIFSHIFNV